MTTFELELSSDLPAGDKVARHDDDGGENDEDRQEDREDDECLRHLDNLRAG